MHDPIVATPKEIRAAGLFDDAGVFLGRVGAKYLRHDGPEHVMAFAPTRSGKGVGLVVPTLLGWTGSAVIHDIKGENWQLTAGWRSRFSHETGLDFLSQNMAETVGFARFLGSSGPLKRGPWCPEEDSNLHALASAST